ncbi:MAG TPA: twin-arginine translocase subunit TatC [Gemmatimonadales bacterium]|jgi:Tat protein translocase TatC
MTNPAGEMSFLDHLEELRKRILLSMAGLAIGVGIGWFLTRHFHLIERIQAPITPYIPGGKLLVLGLVDPFMIVVKFAIILGLIIASPWVLYQIWLFFAPALMPREKRLVLPALSAGLVLFAGGVATGWLVVLPPTIKWLLDFEKGAFLTQPTYDSYMEIVIHLLVAMGIAAELPLVMILLAMLGIVSYRRYKSFRRFALFFAFVGGAILSPAPDVVWMTLCTIPLLLLYEVGVFGAYIIERRRARAARLLAGAMVLALLLLPHRAQAQGVTPTTLGPPGMVDTGRRVPLGQGVRPLDSATARRLGLPAGRSRTFPAPDSVMQALLDRADREGLSTTRFLGDTGIFNVQSQELYLRGHAATDRDGNGLEANTIHYDAEHCIGEASGLPRMFQKGQAPVIGITMRFNTCNGERAVVSDAFTNMQEQGANWFIRGNLAADSSGKRLYMAHGEFTSCDLPDPHYHFQVGEMKWISQSVLAARPAVLYIRDVPIAWLPFIFSDTKAGRRSGILIPHFGFNDIVRTNQQYNRAITNLGYYWAPSDYFDLTGRLDWYANRNVTYSGLFEYNWLNRFVSGTLAVSDLRETAGSSSFNFAWSHRQNFDVGTSLTFSLQYQSRSDVVQANTIDPLQATQTIASAINFQKIMAWGTLAVGGTRQQPLSAGATTTSFPSITLSPNPVALGRNASWQPTFSLSNVLLTNQALGPSYVVSSIGIDSMANFGSNRTTTASLVTPVTIGKFQWRNTISYDALQVTGRTVTSQRVPDASTPDPDDSVNIQTVRQGNFATGANYITAIDLPLFLRNSWKLQPTVTEQNNTAGDLYMRTPGSNGRWVSQGVKFLGSLTSSPDFFGFVNRALGSYQRFRYEFSPTFSLNYSPAAHVSPEYARAVAAVGGVGTTEIPAQMLGTIGLHQTFQAKLRPTAKDTAGSTDATRVDNSPKKTLFSITTSALSYDFEQAKLPGRTGWTTQTLSNSFTSDLLPGFQLSTTHDLWAGVAGSDTAKFSPFLSSLNTSFSLTGHTFKFLSHLFGHGRDTSASGSGLITPPATAPLVAAEALNMMRPNGATPVPLPRRGFTATINYNLSRTRPNGVVFQPGLIDPTTGSAAASPFGGLPVTVYPAQPAQSSIGLTMSFAPTPFWSVTYNSQYDFTHGQFSSTLLQLQRDLHDWRASFSFNKGPNGNFALFFTVALINLPDIKFDYQQSTLQQTPLPR